MNIYELKQQARESLVEYLEYSPAAEPYDAIAEVADGSVPGYTTDLMECAADNIGLAVNEPELGPAFDGSPTPVNIVAANIYEEISNYLHDELDNILEELGIEPA